MLFLFVLIKLRHCWYNLALVLTYYSCRFPNAVKPVLNLVYYVSLCEGLRAGAGSLSYIVHVDCCGLSTIVIKKIIIIIIINSIEYQNAYLFFKTM